MRSQRVGLARLPDATRAASRARVAPRARAASERTIAHAAPAAPAFARRCATTHPHAEVATLAFAYGISGFGYIVTATFLPVIARAALPADSPWLDLFWPIFGAGVILGALLATRVRVSGDLRLVLAGAYLVQAVAIAIGLALPTAAGFALGSFLLGLPFTAITYFALQEVRRLRPHQVPATTGLVTALWSIGQTAGPPMVARAAAANDRRRRRVHALARRSPPARSSSARSSSSPRRASGRGAPARLNATRARGLPEGRAPRTTRWPIPPRSNRCRPATTTARGSRSSRRRRARATSSSTSAEWRAFVLSGVLPLGLSFPYDFGFLPSTLGDDGDPLDVLVLADEAMPPGRSRRAGSSA